MNNNKNEYDGMPIEYLIETAKMNPEILNNEYSIEQIINVINAEPAIAAYLNQNKTKMVIHSMFNEMFNEMLDGKFRSICEIENYIQWRFNKYNKLFNETYKYA